MRRGGLVGLVVLGCSGTRGGALPDARDHDAPVDPCADLGEWATREPRTVAPHERAVGAIAADEAYAYWTEYLSCADAACFPGAIVLRAPLTGGEPETLFERGEEKDQPGALAVTRDYLFVSIGADLWRMPKTEMVPEVVGAAVSSMAADADAVYFVEGEVVRLAADTLERTGLGQPPGTELEVTAGAAWFLEPDPLAIWRIELPGAPELAAQLDQAAAGSGLAVARPDVAFLATWNRDDPGLPPFLTRVGLGDGASELLAELDSLVAIEADGEHVYWLGDRRLSRMPVDGGCIETREPGGDSLLIAAAADGIVVATGGTIALVER